MTFKQNLFNLAQKSIQMLRFLYLSRSDHADRDLFAQGDLVCPETENLRKPTQARGEHADSTQRPFV